MNIRRFETDVAIVGAGGAGVAAGIEAREAGARAIAFEMAVEPGGASIISGGGCLIVGSPLQREKGIEDSPLPARAEEFRRREDRPQMPRPRQAFRARPRALAAGEVAGMAGGHINGEAGLEGTMLGPAVFSGRVAGGWAAEAAGFGAGFSGNPDRR